MRYPERNIEQPGIKPDPVRKQEPRVHPQDIPQHQYHTQSNIITYFHDNKLSYLSPFNLFSLELPWINIKFLFAFSFQANQFVFGVIVFSVKVLDRRRIKLLKIQFNLYRQDNVFIA